MATRNKQSPEKEPPLEDERLCLHADETSSCDGKAVAFFFVGILTLLYCFVEIGVALKENSLTLLSDGLHNFSDAIAIAIAYWAAQKAKSRRNDRMSFGWARTEILGGLINGCCLLSLSLYIFLEAIPRLVPAVNDSSGCGESEGDGLWYIYVAATGLAINTIGTLIFHFTGQGHMHSHAGGGHDHGHGGHGHDSHSDHSHSDHSHDNGEFEQGDFGYHNHAEESKEGLLNDHEDDFFEGNPPSTAGSLNDDQIVEFESKHSHDMNLYAVFLHYLGDMLSSFFVLVAGLLLHFFHSSWTMYLDPLFSLLICGIILFTTVPFVNQCAMILLQSTPANVSLSKLTAELGRVKGVRGVHDLHVWQLVDAVSIGSVHIMLDDHSNLDRIFSDIKAIFHKYGVHSTAIQPEFTQVMKSKECEQNCVESCAEDWCCKKEKDIETSAYGSSHV